MYSKAEVELTDQFDRIVHNLPPKEYVELMENFRDTLEFRIEAAKTEMRDAE